MRYEKPIVMDLSAGARAAGQQPLSCFDGHTVGGAGYCVDGTAPLPVINNICSAGPDPGGNEPTMCYTGPAADMFCEAGGSGNASFDGCTAGPSNV